MVTPPVDDYDGAVSAFRAAWHRLLAAVHATPEPQRQFDRATETGETLAKLVAESAAERSDAAARIKDAEGLTLTALGERISMTKQAAGRILARRKERE